MFELVFLIKFRCLNLIMKSIFLFFLMFITVSCVQEEKYLFKIQEDSGIFQTGPVAISVPQVKFKKFQLTKGNKVIPSEYDSVTNKLWFVHEGEASEEYRIEETTDLIAADGRLTASKNEENLQLLLDDKPVVQYRYEMSYPPKGIDSIYGKSGFIHPIITPKGDTLTRINPPDHWHHYGLWGPWTHTRIDTTRVDFWNLGEGMGTVLFKEFNKIDNGAVSASFVATQEHIALKTANAPQVGLNEGLELKLWDLNRPDRYMFDYTTTFSSPLANGILFEAYRYGGGIGLRFNERWKANNCKVLTSEGNDRLTADGSNARWCIVSGEASDGKGINGILFLSYPENRMHPEPMRVWPIDANDGRGDMFFEFCPIRHEEWRIKNGKTYELKYRMVVFDGELTADEAEAYWQNFAKPITLKRI